MLIDYLASQVSKNCFFFFSLTSGEIWESGKAKKHSEQSYRVLHLFSCLSHSDMFIV